jgi:phosphogluconate dehydratase
MHEGTKTVNGGDMTSYATEPKLTKTNLTWTPAAKTSHNEKILRPAHAPFASTGGLKQLKGNLGNGVIKISAVKPERHITEAPAKVFASQDAVKAAFKAGELTTDTVIVLRFQGPKANGMPELHALTPVMSVMQDRGLNVALVTDGRMSGASGKVPSAIHLSPEAVDGGLIAKIGDGDIIRLDAVKGTIDVLTEGVEARAPATPDLSANGHGIGRELFQIFRQSVGRADQGAGVVV